jgi:hypothetical protein
MATQDGHMPYRGTLNNLTGRRLKNGKYVVGKKSSLDKKRVKSDPAFEGSRQSSSRFSTGQRFASEIYKKIFPLKGRYSLFVKLRSTAILMLKEEKEEKEIKKNLTRMCKDQLKKEGQK